MLYWYMCAICGERQRLSRVCGGKSAVVGDYSRATRANVEKLVGSATGRVSGRLLCGQHSSYDIER